MVEHGLYWHWSCKQVIMCHTPSSMVTIMRWLSMGFPFNHGGVWWWMRDMCAPIEWEISPLAPHMIGMPRFLCEESYHHLIDSTTCEFESIHLVGMNHHKSWEVIDRSWEAICTSNLTSSSIVCSHVVLGLMDDDDPLILGNFVPLLDKTMVTVEEDAPPHSSIKMMTLATSWSFPSHLQMSGRTKVII